MNVIQVCLNGNRAQQEHPALPLTPAELAAATSAAARAGATSAHFHPRNAAGHPSLLAAEVSATLLAVRAACPGLPLGISTNQQIEPDVTARLRRIAAWPDSLETGKPDFASVNFWEAGATELAHALLGRGIGLEAGLSSPQDARSLLSSGLAPRCTRFLIEIEGVPDEGEALLLAEATLGALNAAAAHVPRLLHGEDQSAWPLLRAAFTRDLQARIGFEDVLLLPDGSLAEDNAALIRAALSG